MQSTTSSNLYLSEELHSITGNMNMECFSNTDEALVDDGILQVSSISCVQAADTRCSTHHWGSPYHLVHKLVKHIHAAQTLIIYRSN